jgi:hypothetical protein
MPNVAQAGNPGKDWAATHVRALLQKLDSERGDTSFLGSGSVSGNKEKCFDHACDIIHKAKERWDNRLIVNARGFSFSDEYLKGRLGLLVEIDGPWNIPCNYHEVIDLLGS